MKKKIFFIAIIFIPIAFVSYVYWIQRDIDEINIQTDEWGIPRFNEKSTQKLYYNFGFYMAHHRLFQMDLHRRLGQGTLSEIIPTTKAKEYDAKIQSLMKDRIDIKIIEASFPDELKLILHSYLDGINDYIKKRPWTLESTILMYKIRPFSLSDIQSFIAYMSLSFSQSINNQELLFELQKKLSPEYLGPFQKYFKQRLQLPYLEENVVGGSNSWVVAAKRSESGRPILSNDPHITFSNPGVWFEAIIRDENSSTHGHFLALLPLPVIGHNEHKAWAITIAYLADFYVKDSKTKWMFHHPKNNPILAIYKLNKSENMAEFEQSLESLLSPALNISYIDDKNNIAWWLAGGMLDHENVLYDFTKNPRIINPKEGIIVSANSYPPIIDGEKFEEKYLTDFDVSDRYKSIMHLLNKKEKYSVSDMMRIQNYNKIDRETSHLLKITTFFPNDLSSWDGDTNRESSKASLFYLWVEYLFEDIITPVMSDEQKLKFFKSNMRFAFLYNLLDNLESAWWRSDAMNILKSSYYKAKKYIQDNNIQNWGQLHTITFEHPLGKVALLAPFLNIGPFPVGGGINQINKMSYQHIKFPFNVTSGASMRKIVDMSSPQKCYSILPTGNSGLITDKHYKDQVDLFLLGRYRVVNLWE